MCRINKYYLLDKIANEDRFDCAKTTENILKYCEDIIVTKDEIMENIKQIEASSMQEYIKELDYIDEDDIFDSLDMYEYACYKYPYIKAIESKDSTTVCGAGRVMVEILTRETYLTCENYKLCERVKKTVLEDIKAKIE